MKKIVGSPGTASGMSLRMGQCGFAAASIGVMVFSRGFTGYTSFCYLIASMGLQLLWSFGLACLDMYALRRKRDLQNPVLMSLFVVGDWVTATLSLAAACSSAGVIILYARDMDVCAPVAPTMCKVPDRGCTFICNLGPHCHIIPCNVLDISLDVV